MFKPNQELYAKMAKPFASEIEAKKALEGVRKGMQKLREKFRIAELIVIPQVYVEIDGEVKSMSGYETSGDYLENIRMIHQVSFNLSLSGLQMLAEKANPKTFDKCQNCQVDFKAEGAPKAIETADDYICLNCYEDIKDDLIQV